MGNLQVGFSRIDITPKLGIELYGYYETRVSNRVADPLLLSTLALQQNDTKILVMSVDHCGITQNIIANYHRHISENTGIAENQIYIHATHIHTGPYLVNRKEVTNGPTNIINTNPGDAQKQLQQEYYEFLYEKMAEGAALALQNLAPATLSIGVGEAPGIGFIRRFRMKDGSVQTNPGVGNPNIKEPIGQVDHRVSVLKFTRENGNIVLFHYGNHPDVIGGCEISADWPGHARRILEETLPNTQGIFFNGTMGDVNHINVNADSLWGGAEHSRYMGQVVAGGVLQALENLPDAPTDRLTCVIKPIHVPSNMPEKEDLAEAHRINDLHLAGRDDEIPFEGMRKVTDIARAARMVRLEHGPEAFQMNLSAVAIGNVVLLGIPGQHFSCAGLDMKANPGFEMILPISQVNGSEGYFPPMSAYAEGGYEAAASNFKAGVSELLTTESAKLLKTL